MSTLGRFIACGTVLIGVGVACSADPGDGSQVGNSGGAGGSSAAGGSSGSSSGGFSGTSGSTSGGSGGLINPDGGGSGGTAGLGDAACATSNLTGERVPLDMHIVFDRSGSMAGSLWDSTKNAFLTFINSPDTAGIGVGLQFFPPGSSSGTNCFAGVPPNCPPGCIPFVNVCVPGGDEGCDINEYLPPVVVIQPLPGVQGQITQALNGTSPGGGTPTHPAMQAAAQAVTAYAAQNPQRKVIIVLATDGNPNDCNSDISNVSGVASAAAAANPPVQTFVIGINNTGVNTSGLDQIAMAGGTGSALLVDPANAGAEFLAAIQAIQGQALGCTFQIPEPPMGETLNPNQVNVWYTPGGGTEELIFKVANASACDANLGGWYYNDPMNPTEILLCPKSCESIESGQGAIRIELGCSSVEIPQ